MSHPKIILASASRARKKLLKDVGLRCTVVVPGVGECRKAKSCHTLVIENARRKAESVARKHPGAIVISADTIVVSGKKIIGKPRNALQAKKILKLLSSAPHWVYSGIAVAAPGKKILTGGEKTKVYMVPLTDAQIERYLRKVRPFDKAGGFDIGGPAAFFINRIEGCYFNVVGLPLAHLARLLGKAGVDIF